MPWHLFKGKRYLFIDSLPQSFRGALIFRLGFNEGAQWLKTERTVDSIFVLSLKKDNSQYRYPYRAQPTTLQNINQIHQTLIRDTTQKQTYISTKTNVRFDTLNDVRFVFKNDGLKVGQ